MFTLVLRNEKLNGYNRLGLFILLIHLLFFIGFFLKGGSSVNLMELVVAIAVPFIAFALNIFRVSKNKKPMIPFAISFFALAIIWAGLGKYWMLAAMIILAFFDFTVRKKPSIVFSEESIFINSFPKKIYLWKQMENVILKDRILTLDFKNDHLMQAEIDVESWKVEEEGFNNFCKRQLLMEI